MKKIVCLILIVALFSLSGCCYMGIRDVGEVGLYYRPPYSKEGPVLYPGWIPVGEPGHPQRSSSYPFWF